MFVIVTKELKFPFIHHTTRSNFEAKRLHDPLGMELNF